MKSNSLYYILLKNVEHIQDIVANRGIICIYACCHVGEREVMCVRTRERSYFDYGFKEGEERQLQEFCRRPDFAEDFLLLECAKKANANIGGDLYFSLIRGLSWEQLDKRTW